MKNYLIIGASSGIGRQLASQLSIHHAVMGTYYMRETSHPSIAYQYFDALGNEALQNIPEVLDGVAYCPGSIRLKPFGRLKEQDFIDDFKLQVGGAIKVIQQCLPALKKAENPSIVLFSTVAVQTGFNFHSLVSSSKGAIEGLAKALAAEFAPKIRVNCIAPSITQTKLAESLLSSDEKIKANAERHPLKRIGQPKDIANLGEFLMTDQSSWITGQIVHVDGGMSAIK